MSRVSLGVLVSLLLLFPAAASHGETSPPSPWPDLTRGILEMYYPNDRKPQAVATFETDLVQHGGDIPDENLAPLLEMIREYFSVVEPAEMGRFKEIVWQLFKERSIARIDRIVAFFDQPGSEALFRAAHSVRTEYFTPTTASFSLQDRSVRVPVGRTREIRVRAWNRVSIELPNLGDLIVASRDTALVAVTSGSTPDSGVVRILAKRAGTTGIVLATRQGTELDEAKVLVPEPAALEVTPAACRLKVRETIELVVRANGPWSELPGVLDVRAEEEGFVAITAIDPPGNAAEAIVRVSAIRPTESLRLFARLVRDGRPVGPEPTHATLTIEPAPLAIEPATAVLQVGGTEKLTVRANRPIAELAGRIVCMADRPGAVRIEASEPAGDSDRIDVRVTALEPTEPLAPLRIGVFLVEGTAPATFDAGEAETHAELTIRPVLEAPRRKWPVMATAAAVGGLVLAVPAQIDAMDKRNAEKRSASAGDVSGAAANHGDFVSAQVRAAVYWTASAAAITAAGVLWHRYRGEEAEYARARKKYYGTSMVALSDGYGVGLRFHF